MMKKIWILIFLSVYQVGLHAQQLKNSPSKDFIQTERIYTKLVSGPTPDVSGLMLFANLLPKGGDLHHHFSGSIYVENYLDWVKDRGFCIFKITDIKLRIEQYRVSINPKELSNEQKENCLSVDEVLKDNLFYRNLLMTWSSKDYSNHFHHQTPPDKHFFDTFRYFENISPFGYQIGLELLKNRAKEENVGYIETMLRSSPTIVNAEVAGIFKSLNPKSTQVEIQSALARAFNIFKNLPDANSKVEEYLNLIDSSSKEIDDDTFKMRFLAYTSRNSSPEIVFSRLYTGFAAANAGKKVVGVNIVGAENHHIAMRDYSLHMNMFAFLKNQFPNVKLSLHAGELVLGMVPPEGLRSHINQAVMVAHANRIGHGIDIAHEKNAIDLLKFMAKNKIALEVNLTSNRDILGIKGSDHPLSIYRSFKVPYVISTDDSGISRNNLSGEYLIYIRDYRPTYKELKNTAYNSIRFSFLTDNEKEIELKKLDAKFANFESLIASTPY